MKALRMHAVDGRDPSEEGRQEDPDDGYDQNGTRCDPESSSVCGWWTKQAPAGQMTDQLRIVGNSEGIGILAWRFI